MALSEKAYDGEIIGPEQELAEVQQAIRDIYAAGQAYTIMGGVQVNNPSLTELKLIEARLRRKIHLRKGGRMSNKADFSGNLRDGQAKGGYS